MDLDHSPRNPAEPLLAAWIKWTMDFWESMAQMGPGPAGDTGAFWQTTLKMWQAFFSLLTEPETVAAVFKGINPPSEIILKMAQAGWAGYFQLHRQWLGEGMGQGEALAETYEFENLDQDIFKICSEIYEKDFRQLLNLPQVGLSRLSQERIKRAMDRFSQFQAAMAEFIYLVFLPLKKSLREIKLRDTGGEAPEEFKDYYRRWLRVLEGHYMSLFKSPEFAGNLSQTLNALEDFTLAKQELLADFLEILPVPTNRDMDELYQEVYFLKKQVKDLSKKLARLTAAPDPPEEL